MKKKQGIVLTWIILSTLLFTGCFSTSNGSTIYVDRSEVQYKSVPKIDESSESGYVIEVPQKSPILQTSLDRDDYLSDYSFANFREIKSGNIVNGKLYRSSSPISFTSRAIYATELAKLSNIKGIINLSDNDLSVTRSLTLLPNPWYKELYESENVITLDLSKNYKSTLFNDGMYEAFNFISTHEGPYLLQGSDGVERVGFMSIILESLMGASMEEIESDYMLSYENLYNVKKGSTQFCAVNDTPYQMLISISNGILIRDKYLPEIATNYLLNIGLTPEQIENIKKNLS